MPLTRGALVTWCILALVWAALPARAHTIHFPKRAVVDLWPDRVRVEITQIHDGDGAGREIKERFDRDGDGVIGDAEYGALETFLVDRATRTLSITLDGQKVALSVREKSITGHEPRARVEGLHVWLVVEGVVDRDVRGATLAVADSIPDGRREVAIEVRAHDVGLDAVSLGRVEPVDGEAAGLAVRGIAVGPGRPWTARVTPLSAGAPPRLS